MKIAVAGAGYVGLSNALLLSQKHDVTVYDIMPQKIAMLKERKSPIRERELEIFLRRDDIFLAATTSAAEAFADKDYVIIATPTDYDTEKGHFETSSIEKTMENVLAVKSEARIVIRSTVPFGYTEKISGMYPNLCITFVPEFLREGHSLKDSLNPTRLIVGRRGKTGEEIAALFVGCLENKNTPLLLTGSAEAEAVKLFSNTYLALRVAYFNEIDSFAVMNGLNPFNIIKGVCLDPRIGDFYNNPSFGYGGYCLPKDTQQLLANYEGIPQKIITAVVEANRIRKEFIADEIIKRRPKTVGVYRLTMKSGSDNFRCSAILDVLKYVQTAGIDCLVYEPMLKAKTIDNAAVTDDLQEFKTKSDVIVANRRSTELADVAEKCFTRDLFFRD